MSVSSRSPRVFSVRSEHKVAFICFGEEHGFPNSARGVGIMARLGWVARCWLGGWELGVGPTATLTGAGSEAGNSLMANVSKIPSRKRRKTREASSSSKEEVALVVPPRRPRKTKRDNWWRKRGVHAYQYACPISRKSFEHYAMSGISSDDGDWRSHTAPQTHEWSLVWCHGRSTPMMEQ